MKVLIDNGHGENTPGKRSPDGRLREWAYSREIADMVVDAAVKVVGKNSGADVDSSLYNEFLDKAGDKQ